jgi:hypothetical protein
VWAFFTFKERRFILGNKEMSLLNASVLVLATMVAVLAGMVGYMYWQQNRVLQVVNSLTSYVSTQFVRMEESEDDRASVDEEVEVVNSVEVPTMPAAAPPPVQTDELEGKTSAELKELLSAKGVPYGKRDSKSALLKLLKEQ